MLIYHCCPPIRTRQVSAEEWEEKLQGLLAERLAQLEELRRRLAGEPGADEGDGGGGDSGEGSEEGEEDDEGSE
jgi:hypothetical protein